MLHLFEWKWGLMADTHNTMFVEGLSLIRDLIQQAMMLTFEGPRNQIKVKHQEEGVEDNSGSMNRLSKEEDFQEADIWDIMTRSEEVKVVTDCAQSYVGLLTRRLQSVALMIPKAKNPTPEAGLVQHSAPVDIPDWSKIYGKSPKGSSSSRNSSFSDQQLYEDCDDDDTRRLPPHKWLARKHTRNETSSLSVCEGAGRTLKGRDLTRVRDAVFTKTGFNG